MAIPAITGKLRKKLWLDLSAALGLGVAAGYTYWYAFHLPYVARREQFYVDLERRRKLGENV